MKIAVNTRLLIEGRLEGIGWFTYEVLKRIVKQHPEHEFYFFFDRKFSKNFIFDKNVKGILLQPPARRPVLWYIWFEYSVKRALKKYHIDVFLSPDGFLSRSTKVKSVLVIHDIYFQHYPQLMPWTYKKYLLYFTQRFAKRADQIVTVSNFSKNDIANSYKVSLDKITVAYNGANDVYRPLTKDEITIAKNKISSGNDYFIYIGALLPRKNISNLLKAFDKFKEAKQSQVKLVIVGSKMFKTSDISKTYNLMKYKNEAVFTGRLSSGEIELALGAAMALVYPSYFEGFGIPIIEAMKADVPVITSNVTSMPEIAGEAALLVDPFSVESISNGMLQMYNDESLRKSLIEKGRIRQLDFSWDKTAEQVWESIEKCVQTK